MTSSGRGGGTNFGLRKKALGLSRKASQKQRGRVTPIRIRQLTS